MPELDDAVVQGLYEAAAGVAAWKTALAALDGAVGATSGSQLVIVDKATQQVVISEQPDHTSVDGVLDYLREYHRLDPHVPYIASRPIGEITNTAEVFPSASYQDHPFYRDFWRPYNVRSFVGTKVGEDEQRVAVIALMRSLDHPLYSPGEVLQAGRYLRHLTAAVRIAQYLRKIKTAAVVGYGLMEGSDRPMILLDDKRAILASNSAARAILDDGILLFATGEVLHCRGLDSERRLARALSSLKNDDSTTSQHRPAKRVAFQLTGVHGEKVLGSLWSLRPEATMGAFGAQETTLLTLALTSPGKGVDPVLLGSMFDLTPAEVRLATSLMSGVSLHQVAASISVSITTVRSQLQSVFAKTGTHRQAELIHLLLRATSV